MFSILALVLCIAVVVTAVMADRSARTHHRLRAVGLNLCGIGCLALGLAVIFACGRSNTDTSRQFAFAGSPENANTTVVRLLVRHDGQLESTWTTSADSVDSSSVTPPTESPAAKTELKKIPDTTGRDSAILLEDPDGVLPSAENEIDDLVESQIVDFDARPEWVEQPESDVGTIHQIAVASKPFVTLTQAEEELRKLLRSATDEYINEVVKSHHAARWIGYSEEEVFRQWVSPENMFREVISPASFDEEMHQSHALLEFGPDFHQEVNAAWREVVARARLVKLTIVGGAVLGMLTLLFGYFNADTATRGFYSGRLKFVTTVAILGLIAAGFVIARSIPWLWV